MFSFPPSPFTSFGRCALWASLAAASALSATAADSPPQAVPAAAEAGTGAVESQRERNRVLQKRNPIASEYLISGELGFAPGALADGESVDFRSLLPPSGALLGSTDSTQLTASYLYHTASGRGKPGFAASLARTFGPAERPTTVQVRANLTSAERVVDTALWNWNPARFTLAGQAVYFLDRPRMQSDRIDTRTRSVLLHAEHRLGADHTVYAQVEGWDYADFFRRDMLEFRTGSGTPLPGRGDAPQGGTTIIDGAYAGARLRRVATEEAVDRERLRVQLGGHTRIGEWDFDYAVFHGHWRERRDSFWATFDHDGYDLSYRIGTDPYFPMFTALAGTDIDDSRLSRFRESRPAKTTTRDVDWAGRADAVRRHQFSDLQLTVSAGILHREKERVKSLIQKDVFLRNDAQLLPIDGLRVPGAPVSFLKDRYLLPRSVNLDLMRARAAAGDPALFRDPVLSILEGLPDNYTSREAVSSAYLSAAVRRGRWSADVGLRAERTETDTLGTVIVPIALDQGVGRILADVNNRGERTLARAVPTANRYSTWLPTLALGFDASESWAFRGSYFEQLMRPQYFDIVNYRILRTGMLQVDEGNPGLAPTGIRTLSLAADYRHARLGTLSLELYRLAVDRFFYTAQKPERVEGVMFTNKRVENGGQATLQGFQAQWSREWKMAGFTLSPSAAYTYSESEAEVSTRPADALTLPQRSRHLVQAGLEWSRGRFGGSGELSYQGRALDEVGQGPDRDIYRDTSVSLDAGLWWQVNQMWRATLAAQNLTDHPERSFEGDPQRAIRNEYLATTLTLGVQAWF
jgi:TonB-dependent receptor